MKLLVCPLCRSSDQSDFASDKRRRYLQCANCHLVTVPGEYHLSPEAEKAEYDKHQNDPNDEGYRRFLSRTSEPLFKALWPGSQGLDFGCGPGPTLSQMASEAGFGMSDYDLYYFPDKDLLKQQYDFITLTEVIEHIAEPTRLLSQLDQMLKKPGILALMTKRVKNQLAFATWHYKNDPTHINFYSLETFEWIAAQYSWRLQVIDTDVVFFYKD